MEKVLTFRQFTLIGIFLLVFTFSTICHMASQMLIKSQSNKKKGRTRRPKVVKGVKSKASAEL